MPTQKPGTRLSLFEGFRGYVSRFLLTPTSVKLPARNQYFTKKAQINIDFADAALGRSGLKNKANPKQDLMFSELVSRHTVLYQVYEHQQLKDFDRSVREGRGGDQFDGVTCRNDHLVAELDAKLTPKEKYPNNKL